MLLLGLLIGVASTTELAVIVVDAAAGDSRAFRSEIRAAVAAVADDFVNATVLSDEALFARGGEKIGQELVDCGTDVGCQTQRIAQAGIDLALLVVCNRLISPSVVSLTMIGSTSSTPFASAVGRVPGDPVAWVALRAADAFEAAGWARVVRLTVRTVPDRARVSLVGPTSVDASSGQIVRIRPGRYRVLSQADGYSSVELDLEAVSGNQTLELELKPLAPSAWPWILVGAGLLVGGVFVAATQIDTSGACLCAQPKDLPCECP